MRALLLLLISAWLFSCSGTTTQHETFVGWEPVKNEYATYFQILRKNGDQVLIVFGPGGRSDTAGTYLIADQPVNGLQPLPAINKIVVANTTHHPFITALGREEMVVGAVHLNEVVDPKIKALAANGSIKEVGTADGMDQELIMSLTPQVILDHPFGKNLRSSNKGIPVIHITEYLEEHPLGRAEWIKFFGALLGEEQQALRTFQEIHHRYHAVAEQALRFEKKPAVFFGSTWEGQWFAPPANSYMARLIKDAGGDYCFADQEAEGNITLDLESVLHKVRRSAHFGMILHSPDSITANSLAGGEARLEKIPAVEAGGFYGNTYTSDLFGQALLEPDVVLSDLMKIFHRDSLDASDGRYFKALAPEAKIW